jgi:hypothetical protein
LNPEGKAVEQLEAGHIEFRNVHFSYPTRSVHKISCLHI